LKEVGFYLKLRKCEFFIEQMEFRGHTINKDGIGPNKDKIRAIVDMTVPKTKSNMKSFLRLRSYSRRFIKNFASCIYYMRFLTMKKTKMVWTDECQKEFENIKQELVSDNIMIYPDWNEKFILATNASKQGLRAVLSQIRDRKERPIAYASRGCTISKQNYGISQLEGLGVIWAIDKFRPYLSNQKFTLVTNYKALTKLKDADRPSQNSVLNINEMDIEETEDLTLKKLWGLINKDSRLQSVFTIEESETDLVDPNKTALERFLKLQNADLGCKNLIKKVYIKENLILNISKGTKAYQIKE
jgi:hypothetical protein